MYRYDEFDAAVVRERAEQFRGQVARRLDGSLSEEEFRPLRLMNGLYLQLHAYMLRVAVPYGTLSGRQLRQLAIIADKFDKGYGHFTTRQNIQFNWPRLIDTPDILDALAEVEMHCIQTSGNCIRNVTADHFAGVAADELEDPRPIAELIRQWSTPASRIQLPAAQVQDRGDGRRGGSRGDRGPRHRHPDRARRDRRDRLSHSGRRRAGADAVHRQGDPRVPARGRPARVSRGDPPGLQSERAARQQVQGADQDPGPRDRHRAIHRRRRGDVRDAWTGRASMPIRPRSRGSPPISPPPAYAELPATSDALDAAAAADPALARVRRDQPLSA